MLTVRIFAITTILLWFWAHLNLYAIAATACPYETSHLERVPLQKVQAVLTTEFEQKSENANAQGILYACKLPELQRQHAILSTLSIKGLAAKTKTISEDSPQKRKMLSAAWVKRKDGTARVQAKAEYKAILFETRLRNGKPQKPVEQLSAPERNSYLSAGFSLDYKDKNFQSFLARNKLIKRTDETEICFAWRVFSSIRRMYKYFWSPTLDRRVSKACLHNATDCGGISYLFCAALRANGVPARPLIGRWAQSSKQIEDASGAYNCHVKSEFFANELGWVPVDLSEAISNKKKEATDYFGNDNADFIVMHVNPDLVLEGPAKSIKRIRSMPDFRIWVKDGSDVTIPPRKIEWSVISQSAF